MEANKDKLLVDIALSEEGAYIGFLFCIEDTYGLTKSYLIPVHSLLSGLHAEDGGQAIYAWYSDIIVGQALVSMQVNAAWTTVVPKLDFFHGHGNLRCVSIHKEDPN